MHKKIPFNYFSSVRYYYDFNKLDCNLLNMKKENRFETVKQYYNYVLLTSGNKLIIVQRLDDVVYFCVIFESLNIDIQLSQ